jgi:hypothetical protein
VPLSRILELIENLKAQLLKNDLRAREAFGELLAGLASTKDKLPDCTVDLDALEALIGHFEFEQALKVLGPIENKLKQ